jgi:RNA polymerase sigma factor (sigma-70 family)
MQGKRELIPHLFRTEFRKITAVLCRLLGVEHLEVAEDIASETFSLALETWPFKGIPQNPTAWLYTVAKNKARNHIHRHKIFVGKVAQHLTPSSEHGQEFDLDWSDKNITDSQLQMLFAVCHPAISREAQIGLALRILCGFGLDEIANAFLTTRDTISKRLFRAKEKLREEKIRMEFPPGHEINTRLDAVLITLYLLFNEGYYSESQDAVLREDLCLEAIRLTYLLHQNESTDLPAVNALMALMCFHASRFAARKDHRGEVVLYQDQDENLWNNELIARGVVFLNQASRGDTMSKYHLEANIAYWHTIKADTREKWENILQLYNRLLQMEYSPIAALNRTFALSKTNGNAEAIREAEKLRLTDNHYYFTLLGELYKDIDPGKSHENFQEALALAKTNTDKKVILRKLEGRFTAKERK